jgi:hypothetical protein
VNHTLQFSSKLACSDFPYDDDDDDDDDNNNNNNNKLLW